MLQERSTTEPMTGLREHPSAYSQPHEVLHRGRLRTHKRLTERTQSGTFHTGGDQRDSVRPSGRSLMAPLRANRICPRLCRRSLTTGKPKSWIPSFCLVPNPGPPKGSFVWRTTPRQVLFLDPYFRRSQIGFQLHHPPLRVKVAIPLT